MKTRSNRPRLCVASADKGAGRARTWRAAVLWAQALKHLSSPEGRAGRHHAKKASEFAIANASTTTARTSPELKVKDQSRRARCHVKAFLPRAPKGGQRQTASAKPTAQNSTSPSGN